jgi:hypothetical protein
MLLSLPMSDYFLSAAQVIKRLPKFLSHLARPISRDSGFTLGSLLLGLLYSLALKVSHGFLLAIMSMRSPSSIIGNRWGVLLVGCNRQ